jgi:hypothetical protein
MSVLTLAGKPIDWAKPPAPTARVMWSNRASNGKAVTGSLRTIAFIDHLSILSMKKYNSPVIVIQPPYNTTVAASAGTHDYDACFDWYIPNVPWREQERFARANGMADWWRRPPAFGNHQHGFPLPPREGASINDDFSVGGFKVGKYVDGGWSLYGREVTSSQLGDYYARRTGLAGHALDSGSWFPPVISKTIFNLNAYIARQRRAAAPAPKGKDEVANILAHAPLARLGGEKGQDLWDEWEATLRAQGNANMKAALTTTYTLDTNKRDGLPRLGAGLKRIGGVGIDLIAKRQAVGGAKIKVIKRRTVKMHIDGHDCYGVRLKVTFPSGRSVKYWLVMANLGRGVSTEVFTRTIARIHKAFGDRAIYNFMEVDEADRPNENAIIRAEFPGSAFTYVNRGRLVQTLVGNKAPVKVVDTIIRAASPGMAKVSPPRQMVMTVVGPKK